MIIDSKQYIGACPCGQTHGVTTEYMAVEAGCMKRFADCAAAHGLRGRAVAIYDENTYRATEGLHPRADKEIVLSPDGLHADNHGVALAMAQLPEQLDYLIAVGSGTVHDITRYIAHTRGVPFVSCPTAASVDGFCSSVAAMTWDGFKKTFTAVAPRLVVADLDIISKAPMRLTRAGVGDMIGKFIALAEWRMAHMLTGEYLCERIYGMTMDATRAVMDSAAAIADGSPDAYEKLTYGLLLSGLAMQLLGNSRCASGAEHHISHFIEMQPAVLPEGSDALHGEKVGVGTLLAATEYHRLRGNGNIVWRDYPVIEPREIEAVFGEALSASIIKENERDCGAGLTGEALTAHWEELCTIIDGIPTPDRLLETYRVLGMKTTLGDIGVSERARQTLLNCSPLVRNRLTLMRLRRALG